MTEPVRGSFEAGAGLPDITFGAPDLHEEDIEEVVRTLRGGWIGAGPRVKAFEAQFAAYQGIGCELAAAVNSCSAALHLSLLTAGIGAGDEVITTPLTFCATVNAILHVGAMPVLCDVDPATMNLDTRRLAERITPRTKALLPVHFAGRPCEMDEILAVAAAHGLAVIEDCAHAIEARYRSRPVGTLGDFGCFSFYVTKNLTTGEGGMVVGRQPDPVARARRLAQHGLSDDAWRRYAGRGFGRYDVVECGFKYNMTDLHAALGMHQLRRLEQSWQRRREIWSRYQAAFESLPVTRPAPVPPHMRHAFHLYTLLVNESAAGMDRDEFLQRMGALGINLGIHYRAVGEHSWYRQRLGWDPAETPVATATGRATVSLPLSPRLSDGDVERIVAAVHHVLEH
jgi:dTDP-4-amino-4,6-dideoxygalactose transaminase